ncbi:MAG TPA: hypothetical protein PKJ45_00055 [Rubrivivax sp.]|nr:hypothetical protein [Rubrivivax sp.]
MPRKSAASLAVVPPRVAPAKLKPPAALTADERRIWRAVVDALPAAAFASIDALALAAYCRAESLSQALAAAARDADVTTREGRAIVTTAALQARTALAAARSLRLTRQARTHRDVAANQAEAPCTIPKPWLVASDAEP